MNPLRRGAAAALLAVAAAACGEKPAEPAPAQTPAAPPPAPAAPPAPAGTWVAVRRGDVRESASAIGTFSARRTARLAAQVNGRVLEVLADVGDAVEEGREVVRLDASLYRIEVDQARAAVATADARAAALEKTVETARADVRQAEAKQREAAADLERMRVLWESPTGGTPSIPKSRFDDAVFRREQADAALTAAQSRVAEAQARIEEARIQAKQASQSLRWAEQRLSETTVRAPFAGVVTQRLVDPGEAATATPATHLLEVQETATLELVFALPQRFLADVRAGTPLTFEVEGGGDAANGSATVETVFPAVDEATRSFRCRAIVDNASGRLRPGLLVQVRATTREEKGVLVVPRAALSRGAGDAKWTVLVEGADGTTGPRAVDVGALADDVAHVRGGLADGEKVLVPAQAGAAR